jgi:hypothetical protein
VVKHHFDVVRIEYTRRRSRGLTTDERFQEQ